MKSYQYLSSVDFFYVLLNIHVRDRGALVIAARIFASFHKLLPILAPLLSIGGFPIARGNRYSKTCGVLLRRAPSQAYQSCGISSCCYRYYFLFFLFVWFSFVLFFFFFFFFFFVFFFVFFFLFFFMLGLCFSRKIQRRRESSFTRVFVFVFVF